MEKEIEEVEEKIQHDGKKFSGIAFVSFQTEDMKDRVLEDNQHTVQERIEAYLNKGRHAALSPSDLSWLD